MISSATAMIYFKACGVPLQLHSPNGPPRSAWGMSYAGAMRWFGAHGFRVEWSKGIAAINEGRGALQRYIQTWIEIGAMERVEIIENNNLTYGLVWHDLKGWEQAKLNKFQKFLEEESNR